MRDVGELAAQLRGGQAGPHRLVADPDQVEQLRGDLSDRDRDRRVAVPAIHDRPAVDRDDVALAQDLLLVRDPVYDLLVDGGADAGREALIALERRDAPSPRIARSAISSRSRVVMPGSTAARSLSSVRPTTRPASRMSAISPMVLICTCSRRATGSHLLSVVVQDAAGRRRKHSFIELTQLSK